jgi:hypothetical protein
MGQVKVSTPVPGYSGSVGGVHFADGHALVDEDAAEMTYFRTAGYFIEEPADPEDVETEDVEADDADEDAEDDEAEPAPARNASTEAWRTWAVEHGGMSAEEAGELTRDQLVERFADSEENS